MSAASMRPLQPLALIVLTAACTTAAEDPVREVARLDHPPLKEVSGITRSSWAGVFWVHNDSGDEARLFAVEADGQPVIPPFLRDRYVDKPWPGLAVLNAWNVDWEDIAFDGERLYVAETGNNGNARRDLGVYEIVEPNPYATRETRALRFLPVRYPDQSAFPGDPWHFDCEALFVADGKLHFLTKHRRTGRIEGFEAGTKLYRLDSASTDRENVLTLVGRRDDLMLVTAADTSPDGRRVAVLTALAVWIFEHPGPDGNWLAGPARRLPLERARGSVEAITWKNPETLLIASESRRLFEVALSAIPPDE